MTEDNKVDCMTCQPALTIALYLKVPSLLRCFFFFSMMLCGSSEEGGLYDGFPVRLKETGK